MHSMLNQVYNKYMTRNHFSKHTGPYFINDGVSKHEHYHKPDEPHEDIKPDIKVFYSVFLSFGILITAIGITLYSLH